MTDRDRTEPSAEPGALELDDSPEHEATPTAEPSSPCPETDPSAKPGRARGRILNAAIRWVRRSPPRKDPIPSEAPVTEPQGALGLEPRKSDAASSPDPDDPGDKKRLAALSWLGNIFARDGHRAEAGAVSPDAGTASSPEPFVAEAQDLLGLEARKAGGACSPDPDASADKTQLAALSWLGNIFARDQDRTEDAAASPDAGTTPSAIAEETASADTLRRDHRASARVRARLVGALVSGIRMVSAERDRDEIIRWFVNARGILGQGGSNKDIAKALYASVDTKRFAQLLGHTALTGIRNYKASNLPLALKVALPVTALGAALVGAHGAGVAAFGGAIGLPVVLLLFLGTAGATAVVEAFVKDRSVRDPLTKLLLALVALETARRAKKELVAALRADAAVPERAAVPEDEAALLAHLMTMDPTAFERHVMSFFESDGHPVGVTPRTNDFGVDGYVLHPDGPIIVQCKRYSAEHPVGRPDIQQFKGVIEEHQALRGYFVTTSRFTAEAQGSAALSDRLVLVDGEELIRWHKFGRMRQGA